MTNQLDAAVVVCVVTACAVYLCLSRRLLRILFGFLLLSNAANLVVIAVSGDPTGRRAATMGPDAGASLPVDPLPQALILTAIVIGFSVAAYLTVLLYRVYVDRGSATTTGIEAADGSQALDTRRVTSR